MYLIFLYFVPYGTLNEDKKNWEANLNVEKREAVCAFVFAQSEENKEIFIINQCSKRK